VRQTPGSKDYRRDEGGELSIYSPDNLGGEFRPLSTFTAPGTPQADKNDAKNPEQDDQEGKKIRIPGEDYCSPGEWDCDWPDGNEEYLQQILNDKSFHF
jgi:hypothetical protein